MGDEKTAVTPLIPGKEGEGVAAQKPALEGSPSPTDILRRELRSDLQGSVAAAEKRILAEVQKATAGIRGAQETARQVDGVLERLQKSGAIKEGVDLSSLRNSFVQEALTRVEAQPESEPGKTAETEAAQSNDPVMSDAYALAEQYGLQTGDPEIAEIVTGRGVKAYLDSIEAAGKKRQARVGGAKAESSVLPTAVDTGAGRVAAVNPIENINDPATLIEMGLKAPPKKNG